MDIRVSFKNRRAHPLTSRCGRLINHNSRLFTQFLEYEHFLYESYCDSDRCGDCIFE
jgi:hypothetical protein